jgi:CSLREA domain-containing protein
VGAAVLFAAASAARSNTITVNTVADVVANDGQCSLREAIIAANTNTASGAMAGECAAGSSGIDTIAFNIPGTGVHTLTFSSGLPISPLFTEPVIIDGYTQPGSSPNTNAFPGPLNTVLLIEIDKSNSTFLVDAAGSTIKGLVIHGRDDDISVEASNVTITGNFLGTNAAGTAAANPTISNFGVNVDGVRNNVIIGGPNPADRNLISGHEAGGIQGSFNGGTGMLVQGNFIGTDVTGSVALLPVSHQGEGLNNISNAQVIGNLISGNGNGGLVVGNFGSVVIQGNLIGTQRDGITPLPNGNFGGLILEGDNSRVGGSGAGQANVIAFNGPDGFAIDVVSNNNLISQNSIYGNAFKGITLSGDGTPLPNDNCDVDSSPGNHRQNHPVITSASIAGGNVTVSGTLNSTASTDFRIELFSNTACDPSGFGQGQTFLGFADVTTPVGNCNVTFGPVVFPIPAGQTIITATATALPTDTSEFSACFNTGAPVSPTATGTPTATVTATVTPTPTNTPAGVPTATRTATVTQAPPTAVVPTLSDRMLLLLGAALALASLLLLRRSG